LELTLPEEIMLLALKEKEGTTVSGVSYQLAAGGAVLAELLLSGRVTIEDTRKKLVNLTSRAMLGDPLLDEGLRLVVDARRRGSAQTWVMRFSRTKNLKHRVAESLCRKGVLRADEDKVLGIFKRRIYPELNPVPEGLIVERIREAILGASDSIEPRTVVLISLGRAASLLKTVLSKKELKTNKNRIKQIANGELTGKAVAEAVQAVQAAIMVAAIMPAIMATTTS